MPNLACQFQAYISRFSVPDVGKKTRSRRSWGSPSREEILTVSLEILHSEGLERLSMRHIADRLGCSVASPYAYFKSQEEIVRTLIIQGEHDLTARLRRAQRSSEDIFEQLTAIAYTYWDFATENRELHRVMFGTGMGGATYRRVFPSLPTSYRVYLETLRRGSQSGAIPHNRTQYRAIARTMWAWMFGVITLEMTDMLRAAPGDHPIEEGIRLFIALLRSGVLF
ncbi:MAG: TetR/AcrR family transcriptional regulator [Leptospiraceae bacterium]|nr:TetR/AcrR family transcriptional regulator [Leptospiraceae bacterium]